MSENKGLFGGIPFDPKKWQRLESPERRERMNPEKLAAALGLTGKERVLDLACGTGFFAEALLPYAKTVVGLDHSLPMIGVFSQKETFSTYQNLHLAVGRDIALPFADESFDVVVHVNFFHETTDVSLFHAEIYRVSALGGRLFAVDWRKSETQGGPPLDHRIGALQAQELMTAAGFTIIGNHDLYADQYVMEAVKPDHQPSTNGR